MGKGCSRGGNGGAQSVGMVDAGYFGKVRELVELGEKQVHIPKSMSSHCSLNLPLEK